jgi:hypothetical protein
MVPSTRPTALVFGNSVIGCDRRNIDMHSYRSYLAAAAAMAGLANAPLDAHAVWFAQRAKKVALIYGVGADDLDTVQRFSFIEKMTGYDAAYREFKVDPRIAGPMVLVDTEKQPTLLTVVFFNGIWSKVDGEFVAKGRDQAPTSTLSKRTTNIRSRSWGHSNGRSRHSPINCFRSCRSAPSLLLMALT